MGRSLPFSYVEGWKALIEPITRFFENENQMKKVPDADAGNLDCGADGNRNHDLFDANEALYQLSYSPILSSTQVA